MSARKERLTVTVDPAVISAEARADQAGSDRESAIVVRSSESLAALAGRHVELLQT